MHNKNLFIGLDPTVASRLETRGSMLCKPGSLIFSIYILYIYFVHFEFYHTHNTLNLLHKNPNNSTNIYGRSQQKSIQFFSSIRGRWWCPVSVYIGIPVSFLAPIAPCPVPRVCVSLSLSVYVGIRLTGLAALHSKDASCGPDPDNRNKSAKQPQPQQQQPQKCRQTKLK